MVDQRMAELVTRTILIDGKRTELRLESAFWDALMRIADDQRTSVIALIEGIEADRKALGLASAVRLFVLDYYRPRKQR